MVEEHLHDPTPIGTSKTFVVAPGRYSMKEPLSSELLYDLASPRIARVSRFAIQNLQMVWIFRSSGSLFAASI